MKDQSWLLPGHRYHRHAAKEWHVYALVAQHRLDNCAHHVSVRSGHTWRLSTVGIRAKLGAGPEYCHSARTAICRCLSRACGERTEAWRSMQIALQEGRGHLGDEGAQTYVSLTNHGIVGPVC